MKTLKKVYICHPLRGPEPFTRRAVLENYKSAIAICKEIYETKEAIPFSPIHAFAFLNPLTCEVSSVMEYCYALLGACHELWLYPEWQKSHGCVAEVEYAKEHGIPIVLKNGALSNG